MRMQENVCIPVGIPLNYLPSCTALIVWGHAFFMAWYKIIIQMSIVTYHGISYTHSPKESRVCKKIQVTRKRICIFFVQHNPWSHCIIAPQLSISIPLSLINTSTSDKTVTPINYDVDHFLVRFLLQIIRYRRNICEAARSLNCKRGEDDWRGKPTY